MDAASEARAARFAQVLRHLMDGAYDGHRHTQANVARAIGVNDEYISKIRRGGMVSPKLDRSYLLARYFGISLDLLATLLMDPSEPLPQASAVREELPGLRRQEPPLSDAELQQVRLLLASARKIPATR